MHWYLKALKNYVNFKDRARRKEFWMFYLIDLLIFVGLSVIEFAADLPAILSVLYSLATFLPLLAVTVRRLHDIGKTGWWVFIGFIPIIGPIVLLVFNCLDSVADNQYGPNPKSVEM